MSSGYNIQTNTNKRYKYKCDIVSFLELGKSIQLSDT